MNEPNERPERTDYERRLLRRDILAIAGAILSGVLILWSVFQLVAGDL